MLLGAGFLGGEGGRVSREVLDSHHVPGPAFHLDSHDKRFQGVDADNVAPPSSSTSP